MSSAALASTPEELAEMLASPQLPVQERIAQDLGVDQPFISNARNGKLKRVTTRVTKLYEYASLRIEAASMGQTAASEIDAEAPPTPDSRASGKLPILDKRRYDEDALAGIKAYLQDGYDARLIVEQLAVLRRAQRVRVPGRSSATLDKRRTVVQRQE